MTSHERRSKSHIFSESRSNESQNCLSNGDLNRLSQVFKTCCQRFLARARKTSSKELKSHFISVTFCLWRKVSNLQEQIMIYVQTWNYVNQHAMDVAMFPHWTLPFDQFDGNESAKLHRAVRGNHMTIGNMGRRYHKINWSYLFDRLVLGKSMDNFYRWNIEN